MNSKENLNNIAKHVAVLNHELGDVKVDINKVKNDIQWIKKLIGYMAALMSGVFISVLGAAIKYMFLS